MTAATEQRERRTVEVDVVTGNGPASAFRVLDKDAATGAALVVRVDVLHSYRCAAKAHKGRYGIGPRSCNCGADELFAKWVEGDEPCSR